MMYTSIHAFLSLAMRNLTLNWTTTHSWRMR